MPLMNLLLFVKPGVPTDTSSAVSLFQHHLLEVKNPKPVIHYTRYDYLVTSVLFLSYIMFVWLYISNRKRLNQIVMGLYAGRYANQLAREEVSVGNRVVIFLSALFVFTTFRLPSAHGHGWYIFHNSTYYFFHLLHKAVGDQDGGFPV